MRDARLGPFCRCRAVSVTASGRADFGALNPLSLHERKRELDLGRSRVASGKFVGLLEAVEAVGDGLWLDAAFTGVQELEELVVQQDRHELVEEIAEMGKEAKANGLAVVIWSYPRGGNLSKAGETAIDICAYAAHMAALLGAHIIKVKPPTEHLELDAAKKVYEAQKIDVSSAAARYRHVVQSCFNGRRIVVFSGGEAKDEDGIMDEVRAIRDGGGNGSIIGRNSFQRPRDEALKLLDGIINVYLGKD